MTNNQLTAPQAPVTDEELDQMIWKLERDGGMTPKLLSLMRELREVRKAKGEPVAYMVIDIETGKKIIRPDKSYFEGSCQPLYAALPTPVVLEEMTACKAYDLLMEKGGVMSPVDSFVCAWNACRAAALQERPKGAGTPQNCRSNENVQVVQVQSGATHATRTVQSVDHVDGESLSSIKAASVLDSSPKNVESPSGMDTEKLNQPVSKTNALPASVVDALEKALQAMSFMGDTLNNLDVVCEEDVEYVSPAFEAVRSVLENNSPASPDGWIPVSERMPDEIGRYWCYVEEQNSLGKSHYQWNCAWNDDLWWVESENGGRVTHWMPLPAAPKGVG